jgi:hypothetical protein
MIALLIAGVLLGLLGMAVIFVVALAITSMMSKECDEALDEWKQREL